MISFLGSDLHFDHWVAGWPFFHYFYEVILDDRVVPEIKSDKELGPFVKAPKKRALRGLTSAGKKARGLRNSPVKAPKVRPSLRANRRRGN